jgi:hypothetical protein
MLSPKFLRFQAASSLLAADGTDNPDATAELNAMASILGRWAPKAETKRIVKASGPIKLQPNPNDRPEQAKPDQSGQEAQLTQASGGSAAAPPRQRATPGRRPLFRS